MSPKKLLRLRDACSTIEEMDEGLRFRRMYFEKYPEKLKPEGKVRRVLFCSGQVYYDLVNARDEKSCDDVAILRVEQISPLPYDRIQQALDKYKNAEIMWVQEEHKNAGPWAYIQPRFDTILTKNGREDVKYAGRPTSASTATGYGKTHQQELTNLINAAFD